jgi:hypothetical protein
VTRTQHIPWRHGRLWATVATAGDISTPPPFALRSLRVVGGITLPPFHVCFQPQYRCAQPALPWSSGERVAALQPASQPASNRVFLLLLASLTSFHFGNSLIPCLSLSVCRSASPSAFLHQFIPRPNTTLLIYSPINILTFIRRTLPTDFLPPSLASSPLVKFLFISLIAPTRCTHMTSVCTS